ncbi:hypothetical protein GCM10010371_00350 [Streptomyces subrutilus]|uniref:Uncharacterized protein n=1 Tax=Streptomyces subrutilus TaxID=36818 RepID=A0A918QG30_9ACTN|nr:hypothetical protein GCM10010371_00350 [Streptomyces subrutilus]
MTFNSDILSISVNRAPPITYEGIRNWMTSTLPPPVHLGRGRGGASPLAGPRVGATRALRYGGLVSGRTLV